MELEETVFVWEKLKETKKPIVLYGMGDGADKILRAAARRGIPVRGVFASDEFCRGQQFHGFPVRSYAQAKEEFGDMVVLVSFGTRLPEVIARIRKIAGEQELYAPDVPVAGDGDAFDRGYMETHRSEFEWAYGVLADEQSRRVFRDILAYKVSGKIGYLFDCESGGGEAYRDILRIDGKESYVDVGAYTGDTVREFLEYAREYTHIAAVEPDERNFRKLQESVEGMRNVKCLHYAAYDEETELGFAQRGGRNSAASAKTGKGVRAARLDDLLRGLPEPTYLKFDVEGLELAALRGAQELIRRAKPKLLVSAYHKNDDLFAIPRLVLALRGDYRAYLRHYPYIPAWDTNYYFV